MDFQLNAKLSICELSKTYNEHNALQKVSFDIMPGEFLSILGPSGCGKTTLLRILIGLCEPDTGTIIKNGIDITHMPPSKRGIGIVFQNYALFENMTVLKNVEYALKFHNYSKSDARNKALEMLDIVGLSAHIDKKPGKLSGGQQQRVAIARTLALNPDIILFDEPMSALDVATRISLRNELKHIQHNLGTTMIYVTHDQEEAFALSDRIMIMNHGTIQQLDTPEQIMSAPANEFVQTFVLDNIQAKIDSLSKFTKERTSDYE